MIRVVIWTEYFIFALFAWFFVFQVVVPFIMGTPFFPMLRSKKKAQAIAELTEATEEREIDAIKTAAAGLSVGNDRKAKKGAK